MPREVVEINGRRRRVLQCGTRVPVNGVPPAGTRALTRGTPGQDCRRMINHVAAAGPVDRHPYQAAFTIQSAPSLLMTANAAKRSAASPRAPAGGAGAPG